MFTAVIQKKWKQFLFGYKYECIWKWYLNMNMNVGTVQCYFVDVQLAELKVAERQNVDIFKSDKMLNVCKYIATYVKNKFVA
jgi:hypothetical protein